MNVSNPNLLDPSFDPPLGLMYLGAMLEPAGFDVTIEHLGFYDRDKWVEKIEGYDFYGFSVYTPNVGIIAGLIPELRESRTRFIAGGPHTTALPRETLRAGFDSVVVGEGEYVLPKLLKMSDPPRIVRAERIMDLDRLPYPARHLVPLKKFHRMLAGRQSTCMVSSRGCPYNCAFCSRDVHGGLRLRSPSNVIGEIEEIHSAYGFEAIQLFDGTFTVRPFRQLEEICSALSARDITFRCTGDLRRDDSRMLRLLYDSGCRKYSVGVESGSQKVLDLMRKGTTVERNLQVIREARSVGLDVKVFLMVGGPGETEETVRETIAFVEECGKGDYACYSFIPFPDCDIYKNPDRFGIKIKSVNFDDYCVVAGHGEGRFVVETEELTADDIARLHGELRKVTTRWST